VALANAAGAFVDAMARGDDPFDREAAAALRARPSAATAAKITPT